MGNSSVIARFNGIVIKMYPLNHYPAHFHVEYGEFKTVFAVEDSSMLAGTLPDNQVKQIRTWAMRHHSELMVNWEKVCVGQYPDRIEE